MDRAHTFPFLRALAVLLLLLWPAQGAGAAESLIASGDSKHLWIMRPSADGKSFSLLHRKVSDQPETRLGEAPAIRGALIPGGAVAGDGLIWLFYEDGTVQNIRLVEDAIGRRGFTDLILPSLPRGISVRSIAVTQSGAWVLARVEDARLLDAIDNPKSDSASYRERRKYSPPVSTKEEAKPGPESSAPPATSTPPATPAPTTPPSPEPTTATPPVSPKPSAETPATKGLSPAPAIAPPPPGVAIKADRLLHLSQSTWEKVDLPADWIVDSPAWLITQAYADKRPVLVTASPTDRTVRWYNWSIPQMPAAAAGTGTTLAPVEVEPPAGAWILQQQTLASTTSIVPSTIDGLLVATHRVNSPGKIEISVARLRTEHVLDIGNFSLPDEGGGWTMTPAGDQLALIASDKEGKLSMMRINIRGNTDPQPVPLVIERRSLTQEADVLLLVLVLALVTPVLILMWKREPNVQPVSLPRGLRIADMAPRGMAAFIDLMPCLFAATMIRGVSFDDMINYWPGKSGGWEPMIPGAIAVALYVGHTFLSELFTARTLGKAMMGLRVTGLSGEPPDLWQVLARNLFKILDLIAMPLLIFAIISPNRQRLGDVVARTIVVSPGESEPGDGRKDRQRDGDDDEDDDADAPPDPRPKRPK